MLLNRMGTWLCWLPFPIFLILPITIISSTTESTFDSYPIPTEAKLIKELLARYEQVGKIARPTYNSSKAMKVAFGMRLIQMDIDEKEQSLKTSVWVRMTWLDEHLQWDPEMYEGLYKITIPWNMVWLPDIHLVNTAQTKLDRRDADLMVAYTGWVFWAPHRMYNSACLIDITNYPYDQHTCDMWFQSMSKYNMHLDLHPYPNSAWNMDTYLESFRESQEWELFGNTSERVEKPGKSGVTLKFSQRVSLKFSLTVRRRLGYIGHILMLPSVFLTCLTLVVFCLPPERPDRHMIALSIFASFIVLVLVLVEVAPPTSASAPKLGIYYAFNMTLVMVSVFLSGGVVHISRLGERQQKVPYVLKVIFIDICARILCMHTRMSKPFVIPVQEKRRNSGQQFNVESFYPAGLATLHLEHTNQNTTTLNNDQLNTLVNTFDTRFHRLERMLTQKEEHKELVSENVMRVRRLGVQWRNIALVMDRLCIITLLICLIVSLIFIFPRP